MAYNLGKAHYIASMASKSCDGVGKRNLYAPLTAEYGVNVETRSYKITVSLSCYFGTRINIHNLFRNLVIDGVSVEDNLVDGWVKKEEPGKEVAVLVINGTFNADGTPDVRKRNIQASGEMVYYSDVACVTQKVIEFANSVELEIENIEPSYTNPDIPVGTFLFSTDSRIAMHLETTSFGEGGGAFLYAEADKTTPITNPRISDVVNELSGDVYIVNLQRNTRYYVDAVAANNGASAKSAAFPYVTLAASEISRITPINGGFHVGVMVYNGGGFYQPTTEVEISTDLVEWSSVASSEEKSFFEADVDNLDAGTTYYIRSKTTTEAGIFYSKHSTFVAPGDLYGKVERVEVNEGVAEVFWTAEVAGGGDIEAIFYYRVAGIEEEWIECATATIHSGDKSSFTIDGLNENYFEYEVSADFRQGMKEYSIDPVKFHTVPSQIENSTCDSLNYLVQLICQEVEEIKSGNITIYMNDDTKQWCEDETNDTPTIASMLSRVNRFMRAVGCILCSMDGFIEVLKDSKSNQIFMGKLGWVDLDEEVSAGSPNPVMSGAVYAAVEDLIHTVWHYHGRYDYYGRTLQELNSQTGSNGDTGLVGNQVYTWANNAWGSPVPTTFDNFAVVHIDSGLYAGAGLYWFVDAWNRLDLDDRDIQRRLAALEAFTPVQSFTLEGYNIASVPSTLSDAEISALIPTDVTKDTILLVYEEVMEEEE